MFCVPGYCIGISYAFLWYGSILLGFYFLYAPLLPLIFVHRKLFRRITDCLLSSWESFNTVYICFRELGTFWTFIVQKVLRNDFSLLIRYPEFDKCPWLLSINCFSDWWLSNREHPSTIYLHIHKLLLTNYFWSISRRYFMYSESVSFSPEIPFWMERMPWWY